MKAIIVYCSRQFQKVRYLFCIVRCFFILYEKNMLRRVWRYQRGNQNPYIEEEQKQNKNKSKTKNKRKKENQKPKRKSLNGDIIYTP